jgi:hypothetical protein
MKTVLQIAQDLAPHCAIDTPSLLSSATENTPSEYLLLRCLNEAGKEIATRNDWPELRKSYNLTGYGGPVFSLPSDYSRMVKGWALTVAGNSVRGSLSDEEFNRLVPIAGDARFYRASSTTIELWPYPNVGVTIPMLYQTVNWLDGDRSEIIADDARPLFSDELLRKGALWRWRRAKGQDFTDWLAEFEADFKTYSSFARSERLP